MMGAASVMEQRDLEVPSAYIPVIGVMCGRGSETGVWHVGLQSGH